MTTVEPSSTADALPLRGVLAYHGLWAHSDSERRYTPHALDLRCCTYSSMTPLRIRRRGALESVCRLERSQGVSVNRSYFLSKRDAPSLRRSNALGVLNVTPTFGTRPRASTRTRSPTHPIHCVAPLNSTPLGGITFSGARPLGRMWLGVNWCSGNDPFRKDPVAVALGRIHIVPPSSVQLIAAL